MKLRLFLFLATLFIVSTVTSCNELRYLVSGRTTDAKLDKIEVVTKRGRYGTERQNMRFTYTFDDGALGARHEEDDVSMTFIAAEELPDDSTISVQYVPGASDRSRLKGHNSVWLVPVFFISFALLAFFSVRYWRQIKAEEAHSKASSALYNR